MEANSGGRSSAFFRFEDLRVYHKAHDYILWVSQTSSNIPSVVNNSILIRFNDAARSIAIDIAEGSSRNKSQFIYYLKMAKSSVRECLVYTTALSRQKLLAPDQDDESRNFLMEMTKMIGALISSLQRSSPSSHEHEDDHDFDEDFDSTGNNKHY